MFEGLKRLFRKVSSSLETPPDSVDEPRPQRVDPDPPKNDWFARVRARSLRAAAVNETEALDRLDRIDEIASPLSRAASKQVDDLLDKAKASAAGSARG